MNMPDFFYNLRKIAHLLYIRKIKKSGTFRGYFSNGKLKEEIEYQGGNPNGIFSRWYENGNLDLKTTLKNGQLHGSFKKWDESGTLTAESIYSNGKVVETNFESGRLSVPQDLKPVFDQTAVYQKIARRIISMLMIVTGEDETSNPELLDHAKRILRRYAYFDLSDVVIKEDMNFMRQTFKDGFVGEWFETFKSKLLDFSSALLLPEEKTNLLRIGVLFALFDGEINNGEQAIISNIGEALGLSLDEFKKSMDTIMLEIEKASNQ
jgi:tellurite resistance protein